VTAIANRTKQRLHEGKVVFGLLVKAQRSAAIAHMAAAAGYDYLTLDLQHTTIGADDVAQICAAALGTGVTPIVRVADPFGRDAIRIIDAGAQGIFVPGVESAEQARSIVTNCRFPPLGSRSSGGATIQLRWQSMPAAEVARQLDDNLLIGINVESLAAVEDIDTIAAVDGVDLISVGTNDLTQDMGIPGEYDHPRLMAVYECVVAATRRNGKFVRLGNFADPARLARSVAMGAQLVTVTNDVKLLLDGMRGGLAALHERLPATRC
jgi:2-keto-3-deoxy-L-rhamnonate aldolase RhmA